MSTNPDHDYPMSQFFADYVDRPRIVHCICKKGEAENRTISDPQLQGRVSRLDALQIVLEQKLKCALSDIRYLAGLEDQDEL